MTFTRDEMQETVERGLLGNHREVKLARIVKFLLDQGSAYDRGLRNDGINPYRDEKFAFLHSEINRLSRANAALREHMTTLAEAVDKLVTWFGLAERSNAGAEGSWSHCFGPTIAKAKRTLEELGKLL